MTKNGDFHKDSDIPKLFINADPGSILVGDQREFVRSWNNLKEITVKGNHFIQEHSPKEIEKLLMNLLVLFNLIKRASNSVISVSNSIYNTWNTII